MDDFRHLDHHAILGVASGASESDIKQAYRREIAKYHPDRFRHADEPTKAYARDRSQRINEAYAALRRAPVQSVQRSIRAAATTGAEQLAMTYERARTLLAAGATAEAIRLLRQIQKVDPLYRDVAELLDRAATAAASRRRVPPLLWLGAGALMIMLIAGGVVTSGALRSRPSEAPTIAASGAPANEPEASLIAVVDLASPSTDPRASIEPNTAGGVATPASPEPTQEPTAEASPTAVPATATSVPPTTTPEPPTVTPLPPTAVLPTAVPLTAAPPTARAGRLESGAVLVADDFNDAGSGWADQQASTYTIGYRNGTYAITGQPNVGAVFALGSPLSQSDVIIGADVTPVRGMAGLIFGADNEYRFLIANGSYRIEQRGVGVIAAQASQAMTAGANRLVIAAVSKRVSLYANGTLLANLDLAAPLTGTPYGFVIATEANGGEGVFDNLTVRALAR